MRVWANHLLRNVNHVSVVESHAHRPSWGAVKRINVSAKLLHCSPSPTVLKLSGNTVGAGGIGELSSQVPGVLVNTGHVDTGGHGEDTVRMKKEFWHNFLAAED